MTDFIFCMQDYDKLFISLPASLVRILNSQKNSFQFLGNDFKVDFQENLLWNGTKSIKIFRFSSEKNSLFQWQYFDKNKFYKCTKNTSDILENSYQTLDDDSKTIYQIGEFQYEADLKYKMQQKNLENGNIRILRRVMHSSGGIDNPLPGMFSPKVYTSKDFIIEEKKENGDFLESILASNDEHKSCVICMSDFLENEEIQKLKKCGHIFHKDCNISQYIETNYKCPICSTPYGQSIGDMPPGTMIIDFLAASLSGFEGCDTIVIYFDFPRGSTYEKETRIAYLPDNIQGREIMELFIQGWKRRLLFTIGYSLTRSMNNCIIYNGIHMKTHRDNGSYGYPDDDYLNRVKEEFHAKNIK